MECRSEAFKVEKYTFLGKGDNHPFLITFPSLLRLLTFFFRKEKACFRDGRGGVNSFFLLPNKQKCSLKFIIRTGGNHILYIKKNEKKNFALDPFIVILLFSFLPFGKEKKTSNSNKELHEELACRLETTFYYIVGEKGAKEEEKKGAVR